MVTNHRTQRLNTEMTWKFVYIGFFTRRIQFWHVREFSVSFHKVIFHFSLFTFLFHFSIISHVKNNESWKPNNFMMFSMHQTPSTQVFMDFSSVLGKFNSHEVHFREIFTFHEKNEHKPLVGENFWHHHWIRRTFSRRCTNFQLLTTSLKSGL